MSLSIAMKAVVEAASFTGFGQVNPVRKSRQWRTDVVTYDGQQRQAQQVWDEPIRHFFVNWALLDEDGRNKVKEVFDACRGQADTVLWLDDEEYLCENEAIATDGSTLTYQLQCTYYSGESYAWTETKKDIVPGGIYAPVVTHNVDGAQTEVASSPGANEFTLDDATGLLTWSAGNAPSAGILTVSFQYYFRVAFTVDEWNSVQQYCGPLYANEALHMIEVKPS